LGGDLGGGEGEEEREEEEELHAASWTQDFSEDEWCVCV